ncbi:MAG: helix-turn-helix transcriptional regulator [Leptospiraceae bacterium]|nr:helix-turn-helix transcriptional regulator [Leptospiraceae bacterium]
MNKENYKELFTFLGMRQKDFAQKYGVQASNLSDIVNGRAKHLPIDVILKLNEEYGISIKWLVNGTGDMLGIQNSESLTEDEKVLFKEVRENPKLMGFLKGFIELLKKNL